MMSKGLTIALLLIGALTLTGCSLFGRVEPPLIIVSPAPENPQSSPTAENTPPNGAVEEGSPSAEMNTEEKLPAEITTTTDLMKVPTPTPTPTPTPKRPKLEIRNTTIKLTEDKKQYLIEGQIFNGGSEVADLTNFKIVARLYDTWSNLLTSATGRPATSRLDPQAFTNFRLTANYVAGVDTYKLQGGF